MKSMHDKYIQSLCALHEDDFTRNILKPLFESMGFERVDFNGGPYERGRDLIAQRRIPPSKETYVVYVQSKKIGDIKNSKKAEKLSGLLHQLRQCCAGELIDLEGNKITPNQVYLACPEQISNRLLEEIGSQFYNHPIKVIPYDGPQIISDIKEFKPSLLSLLINIEDKLTSGCELDLSNKELLSALKNKSIPCLEDFYSDLSFFVGSFDSNLLLHLDIQFKDDKLNITEENWTISKKEFEEISQKYEISLTEHDINTIEENFLKSKREYESKSNQNNKKICRELDDKVHDLSSRISAYIKTLEDTLNININPRAKALSNEELLERQDVTAYLRKMEFNQKNEEIKIINFKDGKISFYKDAYMILALIHKRNELQCELTDKELKIIGEPYYKVKVNSRLLVDKLEYLKQQYIEDIALINAKQLSVARLKNFLYRTQRTLSLISKLMNDSFPVSKIISFKVDKNYQDRVAVSPHDIFSTGYDIAVYGGAGVGKTTTLKAYADIVSENREVNLIYIALNRLADEFKKIMSQNGERELLEKDLLIKIILLSRGIDPTNENVESARKVVSNNLTLILDGLDEVYSIIPNIIKSISQFKRDNPVVQLIVSSRDCVSYLSDIDFLGITLLPFTEEQLNRFIRGWFGDAGKSEPLIDSIKNRELFEHIKTPLLATITCSLVEKGINAPSTENEIYSERLRLLTGEYDLHKNIDRQKQKGDLLRKCAVKIAFYMHLKGFRTLYKEEMLNALYLSLSDNYSYCLLGECLEELINPCNLVIIDPITNKYSFGHFRFQEHLASEELRINRNVDLSELATNDWWRGALGLYSQDNDISYLIEDIYQKYGSVKKAKITLEQMINNSPQQKRQGLRKLLAEYVKSDQMDNLFLNQDIDYYYDEYLHFN